MEESRKEAGCSELICGTLLCGHPFCSNCLGEEIKKKDTKPIRMLKCKKCDSMEQISKNFKNKAWANIR